MLESAVNGWGADNQCPKPDRKSTLAVTEAPHRHASPRRDEPRWNGLFEISRCSDFYATRENVNIIGSFGGGTTVADLRYQPAKGECVGNILGNIDCQ